MMDKLLDLYDLTNVYGNIIILIVVCSLLSAFIYRYCCVTTASSIPTFEFITATDSCSPECTIVAESTASSLYNVVDDTTHILTKRPQSMVVCNGGDHYV